MPETIEHHSYNLSDLMRICLQSGAWLTRWLRAIRREYLEGGLDLRAMSLVYTSLLSLAPLLAVGFSLLKAFGAHNQLEPFLLHVLQPLGDKAAEISSALIGFVDSISVTVLGVVGFAALFYTVIGLVEKIETTFNHIWRVAKHRSLARRLSDYLSVILVGPVLVFSVTGFFLSLENTALAQKLIAMQPFGLFYYLLSLALPYVLVIASFSLVYLFMPNTRVDRNAAVGGGLIAGLSWKLVGALFAAFVSGSASYSAIYSSFAAVILFMLWLYVNWLILLIGGVIAFHLQYPLYLNYASRQPSLSMACTEQLALSLMYLIGVRQYRGEPALSMHALADELGLPWEPVESLLAILAQRHLLSASVDGPYQLAHDTDGIFLKDVLAAVRTAGEVNRLAPLIQLDATASLQDILQALNQSYALALKEFTLRDLILERTDSEQAKVDLRLPDNTP